LPRIQNRALATAEVQEMRQRVCAGLQGEVVEVGFGSGLNVPHYPGGVTRVYAVEPSEVAGRLAARRVMQSRVPVEPAGLDGQRLELRSDSVDCALSTFTLCTIPDAAVALSELRRVLITDGAFHFLEHGRAPDAKVARAQDLVQPVYGRIAGGCHLTRDIGALIASAGFVLEDLRAYYSKGPKPLAYVYEGVARKPV
jgi:ubiquinone/menaquinone biosynthesis C-methylase UbiE